MNASVCSSWWASVGVAIEEMSNSGIAESKTGTIKVLPSQKFAPEYSPAYVVGTCLFPSLSSGFHQTSKFSAILYAKSKLSLSHFMLRFFNCEWGLPLFLYVYWLLYFSALHQAANIYLRWRLSVVSWPLFSFFLCNWTSDYYPGHSGAGGSCIFQTSLKLS